MICAWVTAAYLACAVTHVLETNLPPIIAQTSRSRRPCTRLQPNGVRPRLVKCRELRSMLIPFLGYALAAWKDYKYLKGKIADKLDDHACIVPMIQAGKQIWNYGYWSHTCEPMSYDYVTSDADGDGKFTGSSHLFFNGHDCPGAPVYTPSKATSVMIPEYKCRNKWLLESGHCYCRLP